MHDVVENPRPHVWAGRRKEVFQVSAALAGFSSTTGSLDGLPESSADSLAAHVSWTTQELRLPRNDSATLAGFSRSRSHAVRRLCAQALWYP